MSPKKVTVLHIFSALIFAGAIIFSSWILGDSEYSGTITLLLIALYMVPFSILSVIGAKNKDISQKKSPEVDNL